jgi:hypothetical protein
MNISEQLAVSFFRRVREVLSAGFLYSISGKLLISSKYHFGKFRLSRLLSKNDRICAVRRGFVKVEVLLFGELMMNNL